ncbi:DnaB-like helicase C-terminal domain-containing protein [Streptomyces scopuliridis]|uniref:DnaB-like helicase C-terminal domain-containing protein n=1 Tax=Streptomyces scopuliridis TaxID=452529 RepID=UPI00343D27FA
MTTTTTINDGTPAEARASITTGLSDFDALAGPIPRGRITLGAAPPSSGATALALAVARHNNVIGRTVALVNFQTNQDQLMSNLLASTASVNVDRLETVNEGRRQRLERAAEIMQAGRMWSWCPDSRWAVGDLRERLAAIPGLDLLIVDDYGLASYDEPAEGATFTTLQEIARSRNIPVLVTAHLAVPEGGDENAVPTLSGLHSLDQPAVAAETVLIVHRPDREGTVPSRRSEVDLIAVKGWANTGTVTVRFEPEYHRLVGGTDEMR